MGFVYRLACILNAQGVLPDIWKQLALKPFLPSGGKVGSSQVARKQRRSDEGSNTSLYSANEMNLHAPLFQRVDSD